MTATSTNHVYFKRLTLSNVRSFGDEQHLDMCNGNGQPARWTLILGENGVGKTTILQCLASMYPVPAVPKEDLEPQSSTTNAPRPTGVESQALLRLEDDGLVAFARSGEQLVTLKAELASGRALEVKMKLMQIQISLSRQQSR